MSTKTARPVAAAVVRVVVNAGSTDKFPTPFRAQILPVVAAMLAAWLAAGSTGLLGHPLRHAFTWLALFITLVAGWPSDRLPFRSIMLLLVAAAVGLVLTASSWPAVNVLAPVVILGAMALIDIRRPLFTCVTGALAVFAVYRLTNTAIPTFWLTTDMLGGWVGRAAGWLAGQPLNVGATFAGLDYLVLMAAMLVAVLLASTGPRLVRFLYAIAAILVGHLAYLTALAWTPSLLEFLSAPVTADTSVLVGYFRGFSLWKQVLPWNVPALGAVIHVTIAAVFFRMVALSAAATPGLKLSKWMAKLLPALALAAAVMLPVVTCWYPTSPSLEHKKVVAYEKGFLNWLKPAHGEYGRLSVGMYGMFGTFVESLGGSFMRSADLSSEDLRDADLLILFFPTRTLTDPQLQRVHEFVRGGGSLLLLCDHTTREQVGDDPFVTRDSRFNDILAPTHMRVPFDTAVFAIGGWLQSYDPIAHPTTLGITDDRNNFGVVIGSSVKVGFGATPILMGRWGFSDPGDPGTGPAMLGNERYEPGKRLGDLVLVAEERLGQGRILTFGDTSSFVNGINVNAWPFTSRIVSYLAEHRSPAPGLVRQLVAILLVLFLVGFLVRAGSCWQILAMALVLAASVTVCIDWTCAATQLLPDGRRKSPNNVALIDVAHLGGFSEESTRPEGTFGIEYNLMRNDYLVLAAPEITPESLARAGLLLSIAPGRAYSAAERRAVRDFVEHGGIFILTVGYDRVGPSRQILADFGFTVGAPTPKQPPGTEPVPFGHFKSPYVQNGSYMAHVRYWAGWPIACSDPAARVIGNGPGDVSIIELRQVGQGKIVVIGDSEFVLNKNLEHEDGSPVEGMRENADFWRWFLADLRGLPAWLPSPPAMPVSTPAVRSPKGSAAGAKTAPADTAPAAEEDHP